LLLEIVKKSHAIFFCMWSEISCSTATCQLLNTVALAISEIKSLL
jgi:hypothetical protein